mgnify:CR=1 FL=1
MSAAPVMILAGGTGGHVYPALAVAEELRSRGVPVVWMGTRRGLEARVVPAAGFDMAWVEVRGLRGKSAAARLAAPLMLVRALAQALAAVARRRPRLVLGMGGYVSGPGALAAWLLRRPLLIHEQNAVAGLTNRLLGRLAAAVLEGFQGAWPRPGAVFTGNPVRASIAALGRQPAAERTARSGPPRLLVVGGSLGAQALNRSVPAALARLPEQRRPEVRHQAGASTLEVAREAYREHGVAATVSAYIDDMAGAYAWADLAVCRAGALTVAELATAGLPAVLVPFPHAVDDHQRANAAYLADAGAALLLPEAELSAERLGELLDSLLGEDSRRAEMARAARALGRPDAAARVADLCLEWAA